MARPIETDDVAAQLATFGELAVLVTVTADACPHVGSVLVRVERDRLVARVGGRTRDNVAANPAVSLTWVRPHVDYQLIVDGTAAIADSADGDGLWPVEITVRSGILHRLAGRGGAGPSCRPLSRPILS
jgi:Pyridoxamine 5'-phosphate oxidase